MVPVLNAEVLFHMKKVVLSVTVVHLQDVVKIIHVKKSNFKFKG
jgi:hypothetical protein